MTVKVRRAGEVTVIDVEGSLTAGAQANALRVTVDDLLAQGHHRIVINMQKAKFIDSEGLGEMLACKKKALEKRGDVKLLMLSDKVYGVLVDASLTRVFQTFRDEASAVGSF